MSQRTLTHLSDFVLKYSSNTDENIDLGKKNSMFQNPTDRRYQKFLKRVKAIAERLDVMTDVSPHK